MFAPTTKTKVEASLRAVAAGCLLVFCLISLALLPLQSARAQQVVIKPAEYAGALRNPLKGFVAATWPDREPSNYATLVRVYIKWSDIENDESDGVDKIRAYCDAQWKDAARLNVKVIPRVYLQWASDEERYWPADLQAGDYNSEKFKRRLVRLIGRLGQVWDNDPRVAFVQMGLIGTWGEQHTPSVSPELQKLMGDAFSAAFKHKLVMVRHPWDFRDYKFGVYWDSFAHIEQEYHAQGILKLGNRWKTAVIGGETAYDWGRFREQPGANPTETVSDTIHRDYLVSLIRQTHCDYLGWVADYDRQNPAARAGAEEVQKAFGYRFVLNEVRYPATLAPGQPFRVSFAVTNTGSTPFYYPWPVEVSLLDATTKKPVWKANFPALDIRRWLLGDFYSPDSKAYAVPPALNRVEGQFAAPQNLPAGRYILALAICDPAGELPAARFATANYFTGGYHPIGYIGVRVAPGNAAIDPAQFDDPASDQTLHYLAR